MSLQDYDIKKISLTDMKESKAETRKEDKNQG
jgi:hypothetical protein